MNGPWIELSELVMNFKFLMEIGNEKFLHPSILKHSRCRMILLKRFDVEKFVLGVVF